ncbi:unnamed protein product [Sphagnum balticum]
MFVSAAAGPRGRWATRKRQVPDDSRPIRLWGTITSALGKEIQPFSQGRKDADWVMGRAIASGLVRLSLEDTIDRCVAHVLDLLRFASFRYSRSSGIFVFFLFFRA